jgi:hypothetical protein
MERDGITEKDFERENDRALDESRRLPGENL